MGVVAQEINEELDAEIEDYELSINDIYPGDSLKIRWRSSGAFIFDARVYISEDTRVSTEDVLIVDEECITSPGDHCQSGVRVEFECHYPGDNSFNCDEEEKLLKDSDLTEFLGQFPQGAYVILELCNDGECDTQALHTHFN